MKKIILFLFLIVVAFQINGENLENKYNIIPQPQKIIERNGSFTINSQTIIITDNSKEFIKIVNQFIERFKNVAGINLKLTYDNNKKINNAIADAYNVFNICLCSTLTYNMLFNRVIKYKPDMGMSIKKSHIYLPKRVMVGLYRLFLTYHALSKASRQIFFKIELFF